MQVSICNVIMHHCIMHKVRVVSRSLCYERALLHAPVLGTRCFARLCQARIHSRAFGSKQYIAAQLLKCLVANIALVVCISIIDLQLYLANSHIYFFSFWRTCIKRCLRTSISVLLVNIRLSAVRHHCFTGK